MFFYIITKLCDSSNGTFFVNHHRPVSRPSSPRKVHFDLTGVTPRPRICRVLPVSIYNRPVENTSLQLKLISGLLRTLSAGILKLSIRRSKMLHPHGVVFEPGEVWSNSRGKRTVQVSFHICLCLLKQWMMWNVLRGVLRDICMTAEFEWTPKFWLTCERSHQCCYFWEGNGQKAETDDDEWTLMRTGVTVRVRVRLPPHSLAKLSRSPKSCFSFLSRSDSWGCQKPGDHCSLLRLIQCD